MVVLSAVLRKESLSMSFIRSPFTDAFSDFENNAGLRKCKDFNMQLALCKEAYGLHRAQEKCKNEYDDFRECAFGFKQVRRCIPFVIWYFMYTLVWVAPLISLRNFV